MKTFIASIIALAFAIPASAANPPFATLRALYNYDPAAPTGYRDAGVTQSEGAVTVHAVEFASPRGGQVTGLLVLPAPGAPAPLVLWSPGLGGTKYDLLSDAIRLASSGAASFLIDPPSARAGGRDVFCSVRDRGAYIQQVVDLRRAIDVLGQTSAIDASRVASVGFSFGSSIAGTLAGVEPRILATVIDSGRAFHSNFLRDYCKYRISSRRLLPYLRTVRAVDPVRYVGHVAPHALLLQSGRQDFGTPRAEILALFRAASAPKELRWYQAGHALNDTAAGERQSWLVTKLRLTGTANAMRRPASSVLVPPTDGCVTGALRSKILDFRASDNVALHGVLLGAGPNAVILTHEANANLCNWLPFAERLASRGFRVLAYDSRVLGVRSTTGRLDRDVIGAEGALAKRGIKHVIVAGASAGGTAAMTAAAEIPRPMLAGVVVLSSPARYVSMDAARAARHVTVPSFFAVGSRDTAFTGEMRRLAAASAAKDKQLIVVPSSGHGTQLVDTAWAPASFQVKVFAFIKDAFAQANRSINNAQDRDP